VFQSLEFLYGCDGVNSEVRRQLLTQRPDGFVGTDQDSDLALRVMFLNGPRLKELPQDHYNIFLAHTQIIIQPKGNGGYLPIPVLSTRRPEHRLLLMKHTPHSEAEREAFGLLRKVIHTASPLVLDSCVKEKDMLRFLRESRVYRRKKVKLDSMQCHLSFHFLPSALFPSPTIANSL
jgi:2-polyprenyl-6-methoxyphenol hydroxylase-like FAD-dependent oxidoreductase